MTSERSRCVPARGWARCRRAGPALLLRTWHGHPPHRPAIEPARTGRAGMDGSSRTGRATVSYRIIDYSRYRVAESIVDRFRSGEPAAEIAADFFGDEDAAFELADQAAW